MIRFQWSCALRSGLPTEQRSDSLFCARCGYSIIFFQTCLTAARGAVAASNARQQRVMTKFQQPSRRPDNDDCVSLQHGPSPLGSLRCKLFDYISVEADA